MQAQGLDLPRLVGEHGRYVGTYLSLSSCPEGRSFSGTRDEHARHYARRETVRISIETIVETDLDNPPPTNLSKNRPVSEPALSDFQTQQLEGSHGDSCVEDQPVNGVSALYNDLFCAL